MDKRGVSAVSREIIRALAGRGQLVQVNGFRIDRKALCEAGARFGEIRRKSFWKPKRKLTFPRFLALYLDRDETCSSIGEKWGRSGERVRQIGQELVAPLFPKSESYGGFRAEHWRRARQERTRARKIAECPWLVRVMAEARRFGYEASFLPQKRGIGLIERHLLAINGYHCLVHAAYKKTALRGLNDYARVATGRKALKQADFLIALVRIRGYRTLLFVLPVKILMTVYGARNGRPCFYLPLKDSNERFGRKRLLDYWRYEGRRGWRRLSRPKDQ